MTLFTNPTLITDILIVGSGCSGLFAALNLPKDLNITIISKDKLEKSNSFLAQGGICRLKMPDDYHSFFEDTLKAGHYENNPQAVDIMITSSPEIINDLVNFGVSFQKNKQGELLYTKEGAHSTNRILFHKDITGKEITSHLLKQAKAQSNIHFFEDTCLLDLLTKDKSCFGAIVRLNEDKIVKILAEKTILATGGIGGLYEKSTNVRHLTGDAIAIAIKHKIELKDLSYIQIHPTTFYHKDGDDSCFLISESVRGEGAKLYDKNMQPFVNELLPRDIVTQAILKQMAIDQTEFVWEDLRPIPKKELQEHFPTIVNHCLKMGYNPYEECIPVVPAQHYFMGGIKVNLNSQTSMSNLYAVGETACNGVHGKNRLASNSLLESLVFAKRAAQHIKKSFSKTNEFPRCFDDNDINFYSNKSELEKYYKDLVLSKIEEDKLRKERTPINISIKSKNHLKTSI